MIKKAAVCVFIIMLVLSGCGREEPMRNASVNDSDKRAYEDVMKKDILCLMMAYPGYITGVEKREDGNIYVIMKSGKRIVYDDKKVKTNEGKLSNPDIQDMMEQIYPIPDIAGLMPENLDPGRIRVYQLLYEVYGSSKGKVQSNLGNVKTIGGNFQFNKNNMASKSLKEAFDELVPIINRSKAVRSAVFPSSGTFNYRYISGTNRLSPHSFGIAIDLARDSRDYWKWASRSQGEKRLSSYPREIVAVFEKHNFVWGGKWGHFDILHFEYRPEIIHKARYFGNSPASMKPWYDGVPYDDSTVRGYIDTIEKALN